MLRRIKANQAPEKQPISLLCFIMLLNMSIVFYFGFVVAFIMILALSNHEQKDELSGTSE
jgi:hypothetical protein